MGQKSRRVRYSVAMSLDGYIAGPNGEYDWILMRESVRIPMPPEGPPLAAGHTAEIHAVDEGHVLKLYRPGVPVSEAEKEVAYARAAHAAGVPTPAVIDVIEVEGRRGVVFERVTGPTMLEQMLSHPATRDENARLLADLQADMHDRVADGLPDLKRRLERLIARVPQLARMEKDAVVAALGRLPGGSWVCHGDFHPDNVILTAEGPVIIDWVNAASGHRLADVARTCLLLESAIPAGGSKRRLAELRQRFLDVYLERYRESRPFTDAELADWRLPVAAARLDEEPDEDEERKLLAILEEESHAT